MISDSTPTLQLHTPPDESSILPKPELRCRPIIKDIGRNSHHAFSGLGRHCANDLLFTLALHPGTPCHIICTNDVLYQNLKEGIFNFLSMFDTPTFHKRTATIPNTLNPFTFNDLSNESYISSYIYVFRRVKVCLCVIHGVIHVLFRLKSLCFSGLRAEGAV